MKWVIRGYFPRAQKKVCHTFFWSVLMAEPEFCRSQNLQFSVPKEKQCSSLLPFFTLFPLPRN